MYSSLPLLQKQNAYMPQNSPQCWKPWNEYSDKQTTINYLLIICNNSRDKDLQHGKVGRCHSHVWCLGPPTLRYLLGTPHVLLRKCLKRWSSLRVKLAIHLQRLSHSPGRVCHDADRQAVYLQEWREQQGLFAFFYYCFYYLYFYQFIFNFPFYWCFYILFYFIHCTPLSKILFIYVSFFVQDVVQDVFVVATVIFQSWYVNISVKYFLLILCVCASNFSLSLSTLTK